MQETGALLAIRFNLVSWLAYSLTLKMEATCSTETSVGYQRTTRQSSLLAICFMLVS
jgi:hypothetical protein